jgi:hypothetical protein
MKPLTWMFLIALPLVLLTGCRNDADLRNELARISLELSALRAESESLRASVAEAPARPRGPDLAPVQSRLDRHEAALEHALQRISELEVAGPAATPEDEVTPAGEQVDYAAFREFQDRYQREREERERTRRREQMERMARMAQEAGLEFDPEDPQRSIMRIMANPESRAKAMELMRSEFNRRRLETLNLSEYQTREVMRIEAATRDRIREATAAARERGAGPEEIAREAEIIRSDTERELRGILTDEQFQQYQDSAGAMAGMIPPDIGSMFPGMLPGSPR